jgi:hypothetical protein
MKYPSKQALEMIEACKRHLKREMSAKVFDHGFKRLPMPRLVRRMLGRTVAHRVWMRGWLTQSVDVKGRCYRLDGSAFQFRVPAY